MRVPTAYDTGFATMGEVGKTMSFAAVRRSAKTTRPSVNPRRAKPADVGLSLGRQAGYPWRPLYASLEEVVLAVAPPRGSKTAWLGNVVIEAPGACVATSTKPDLYEHTAALRENVSVFNPEHLGNTGASLRWSPLEGCADPYTAMVRAGYFLVGSPGTTGEDRPFWQGNAFKVLCSYLYAAAISGRTMANVARWVTNSRDRTPLDILERRSPPGWAPAVRQILDAPDRTRDSVFLTLALTFQFMADPELAQCVMPPPQIRGGPPRPDATHFDVHRFIRECGTLYLIASERPYGSLAPLFSALTGHIFETAKFMASKMPNGRLDPPLLMALDEVANICPVPLERWTSDGGGRGIPIVLTVQSPSQLYDRWGKEAGRTIWSNAAVKLIFGGLTVAEHLDEISKLCGERDEPITSHSRSPGGGHTHSTSMRRVPVLSPHELRTLGPFRTVILHRTTRPVLGRIQPVWTRRDVRQAARAA